MILRFLPAILVALLLGFLGLTSIEDSKKESDPFKSKLIGQTAPIDDNNTLTLQVFDQDKVTLVNFFASWCLPCRVEHPQLTNIKNARNIQLIGIAFKDKTEDVQAFLEELGDPYDVVIQDPDGLIALAWGIHGAPETFILDKENKIRYNHAGPIRADDLVTFVPQILKAQ